MKAFLFFLFALLSFYSQANTYYFSTLEGDDARTYIEAQNPSTPWRTLQRLNSFYASLKSGDVVLLKRGETFTGAINMIDLQNSVKKAISFGAYGSGSKPIITGLKSLSGWISIGGGIYEKQDSSFPESLNLVVFNDTMQPMGRWPKVTDGNNGYLQYQSHMGTSSITSNAIAAAKNFVGGEVVIRKYQWLLDRGTITNQTANTVTYDPFIAAHHPNYVYEPIDNHGFFFQNHVNTLTALGDWSYDQSSRTIKMFFGNNDPHQFTVKVPTEESLVHLEHVENISFEGIYFKGSNANAINIIFSRNIHINNCDIALSGVNAINTLNDFCRDSTKIPKGIICNDQIKEKGLSYNLSFTNGSIVYTANTAIGGGNANDWTIKNNSIRNTGVIRGMGKSGDNQYNGITYVMDRSVIENNKLINTGYIGIHFVGDSVTIKNNYVDSFCLVKTDGGGIYTYGATGKSRKVIGNVVSNGIGDIYGINAELNNPLARQVHGIYMDALSDNVAIENNTVYNNPHAGLFLGSCSNISVTNNLFYNNGIQVKGIDSETPLNDITIKHNQLVARDSAQLIVSFILRGLNNNPGYNIGTVDSNYYSRPLYEPQGIITQGYPKPNFHNFPGGGIAEAHDQHFYSLDTWKAFTNWDLNTRKSPFPIDTLSKLRFEVNASNAGKVINLDGTYVDIENQPYNNTFTLAPFTSVVLLKSDASNCEPPTFLNNGLIILDATCNNNDGNINIIPTSGTAPFMYSIDGGTTYVAGPNAGYGFQNLASGTYKLTLKDANGCVSAVVEREVKLNCATTCIPPTLSLTILDASCSNNDGNVNIIPTGGIAPFMYSINGGTTYITGPDAGYDFQGLAAGTYKLRLKDANGCESEIVDGEVKLNCTTTCTPPTFVNNGLIILDATCANNDGNINILPTSGTAPFMYSINGGVTYVKGADGGYGFQGLSAGTYKLRLKDAKGCESAIVERAVKMNCASACNATFTNTVKDAGCANNDGTITIQPTGGTAPYMYSINGGSTYVSGGNAGYTFNNLAANTYRLRIKDATGCESHVVDATVKLNCTTTCTPPTFLNNGLIVLDASCGKSDGSISIIPTSGTAPFMYSINGGATYGAGPDAGYGFQNLAAGTYQLRLKDSRGCESAIVERTVRNYYNCPGMTVSKTTSDASLASSNKDVISTYPNPNKGQFKLLLQNFKSSKAEVSIVDAKGTVIQKRSLNLNQNTIADFNLKGKAPGMYLIKVVSSNGTKVSKVLIQ